MSLCLTAGAVSVALAWSSFTLSWLHSVEHIEWQEDWQVTPSSLELTEARVKGTGAGMEPPADARFEGGWWHYRPAIGPQPSVVLARSDVTPDWRLCHGQTCFDLARFTRGQSEAVTLHACPEGSAALAPEDLAAPVEPSSPAR